MSPDQEQAGPHVHKSKGVGVLSGYTVTSVEQRLEFLQESMSIALIPCIDNELME